jgi:translation initiation factor 1
MKKRQKHSSEGGIVFSTNPDFVFDASEGDGLETPPPQQQQLRVMLDRKQRGGKEVTLVTGFRGTEDDLKALAKMLKTKCGVGGSTKDGDIIVQGDHRAKVLRLLLDEGYKAKQSG